MTSTDLFLSRCARLLPLVGALAAAGLAQAETSPYSIGASQSVMHDSNVYLAPDSIASQSDTVYTTSLLGSLDQPIGRQRVFGNFSLRENLYGSHTELNNLGYGILAGLDWETINHISGNLRYEANRSLAQLSPEGGLVNQSKNIETSQQFDAVGRIGVVTRMTAAATYSYRNLAYSSPLFAYREFSEHVGTFGFDYQQSSALMLGTDYRYTQGKTPHYGSSVDATAEQDDFRRNDIDLTARWVPTGASTVTGRLSYGKETHSVASTRSFSGTTGSATWNWRPTGKLEFDTTVLRDTGNEATFQQSASTGNGPSGGTNTNNTTTSTGDDSRITNSLQIRTRYAATAKISINLALGTTQRTLVGSSTGVNANVDGHDRTNTIGLGAKWTPTRNVEVGCSYSRDKRTSNADVLSLPYSANSYGCFGQFLLQ